MVGAVLLGGLGLGGIFLYYGLDPELPRLSSIGDYHPKVVTRVLARDGQLIGEIFEERRTVVPREKIPAAMIHALVDAEDAQFYEHKGLDYSGMVRALIYNLRPGAHLQGASTLTQQLVRNFLLKTSERTLKRKVQEMILARRIETALSKDEIIALYLNQIEFGHQRFGVEEAARFYFGKPIAEVNAGEAALLASLPKSPTEMDPWKRPERVKDRQRYVLSQMLRYGHISKSDAEYFAAAPIQVVRPAASVGTAPEFVDEVRKLLTTMLGPARLPYLGTTVVTTCDVRIQKLTRQALERNLELLDERQDYRKPLGRMKNLTQSAIKSTLDERALRRLHRLIDKPTREQRTRWLDDRARAFVQGRTVEAVVVEIRAGKPGEPAGLVMDSGGTRGFLPVSTAHDRYNPKQLPIEKRFSPGDILVVRSEASFGKMGELPILVPEFGPQGAVVVLDPVSREVRAIVGGYGYRPGSFDRALQARRQPGSAFKPFLYAAAFASRKYTPASVVNDSPQIYQLPGMPPWAPKNAESHEFLGPVRLRVALAKSLNTVASQLVYDLGADALVEMARSLGIESKLEPNLSLGIGSSVVTLIEMTNAFATFAAGGKRATPILISRIGDEEQPRPAPEQGVSPEVAYLVTSLMESVIEEGTGVAAKGRLKRPAAGKTGTTNADRDAWFVGFTPDLAAGVWVGFDDMRELGRGEQGARSALPVWIEVMTGALRGAPPQPFLEPAGIVTARIDAATGLIAVPGAPGAIDEKFLQGTEPVEVAPEQGAPNPDTFLTQ